MLKITLILCAIAMVMACSIPSDGNLLVQMVTSQSVNPEISQDFDGRSNVLVQMVTTQEMEDLLKQNPQEQLINREISQDSKLMRLTNTQLKYSFGKREKGDRAVAEYSEDDIFLEPQDYEIKISYPKSGKGDIVTCVEIVVDQSSTLGSANIYAGGIGKNNIGVVIKAQKTDIFFYTVKIYSK